MSRSLNVILFGQTGAGKSSVINLIAGKQIAKTSNGAAGCTLSFTHYAFVVNERAFHIWDTVGLDEPGMELEAIEQAYDLILNLMTRGGVDLLLFCIRAPRITATSQANYRLFDEVFCRSLVPIALVITHLEHETDMEAFWERNSEKLGKFGLKAAGHACVTGLPTHHKYQESRRKITMLLEGHNSDGRFNMPADTWLIETLRSFSPFASLLKKKPKKKDVMQVLLERCRMDPRVAEEIATKLAI